MFGIIVLRDGCSLGEIWFVVILNKFIVINKIRVIINK